MAKFTAHVAVHGERGTEFFAPGDEVPGWAADKVGDHVTDAGADAESESENDEDAGSDDDGEAEADSADAPDFTAPRRQSRSRRK